MNGVILITGAAGGLGRSLCRAALNKNNEIVLLGRTKTSLIDLKTNLTKVFPDARISVASVDLCNGKAVEKTVVRILRTHGRIKTIINNAGTWIPPQKLVHTPVKTVKKSIELNFYTAFNLSQIVLQKCKPLKGITIINVGATSSKDAWPEVFPFCAGKGLLYQYTKALAREVGKLGVHVAHVTVDGMLDNERTRKLNPKLKRDDFIQCEALAEDIFRVIEQEPSCWTMDWDVRSCNEDF